MSSNLNSGIPVNNAGIVLMNSYIPLLFERLGVVNNNQFISEATQADAVNYLQFIITGLCNTNGSMLTLNKILCGLNIHESITKNFFINNEQQELVDGLIQAFKSKWATIGNATIEEFRGTWLVRDGMLIEQKDKWELHIQKQSYDVLLTTFPMHFNIINYPWMKKPLYVHFEL